jgi:hypothetical protein
MLQYDLVLTEAAASHVVRRVLTRPTCPGIRFSPVAKKPVASQFEFQQSRHTGDIGLDTGDFDVIIGFARSLRHAGNVRAAMLASGRDHIAFIRRIRMQRPVRPACALRSGFFAAETGPFALGSGARSNYPASSEVGRAWLRVRRQVPSETRFAASMPKSSAPCTRTRRISVSLAGDSSASRFIQSLNQPRRVLSKSFLAAMLDRTPEWGELRTVDHRFALSRPALRSAPSKKSFSSVSFPILA